MQASKTLLFIVSVLILLGLISAFFPEDGISFGKRQLYFPTIEEMLTKETGNSTIASQRMRAMEESLRIRQYQDSLYADSLSFYTGFFNNHSSRIHIPDDNWGYFNSLFEALDSCQTHNRIVHILHYGDSQIEGDRITGYIRQKMQEKFGGNGPGLLPAIQAIPSAVAEQSFSGNMNRFIISGSLQSQANHKRYGVLGQMSTAKGDCAISVATRDWKQTFENSKEFQKVRLFVGEFDDRTKASLTAGKHQITRKDRSGRGYRIFEWNISSPVRRFTIHLTGPCEIYGMAVDGQNGVAVDNIPFRGSSGTFFTAIQSDLMRSMLNELNTRLILLEFGGNSVPYIKSDKAVNLYKEQLSQQIRYFRKLVPDAKIILIGPSDMSTKINGKLQTYPYLEPTVEALKEAALENGAAFWDMYAVMGGHNSMIEWVKNSPSLAAPDYIHFSVRGADKIADLFYQSLMIYYDYYHFEQDKEKKEK